MRELHIGLIGIIAGVCTTIAFIPQVIKILSTRHARDISLVMYVVFSVGVSLWLIYGILIERMPIIVFNSITLVLCLFVIAAKIMYDKGTEV